MKKQDDTTAVSKRSVKTVSEPFNQQVAGVLAFESDFLVAAIAERLAGGMPATTESRLVARRSTTFVTTYDSHRPFCHQHRVGTYGNDQWALALQLVRGNTDNYPVVLESGFLVTAIAKGFVSGSSATAQGDIITLAVHITVGSANLDVAGAQQGAVLSNLYTVFLAQSLPLLKIKDARRRRQRLSPKIHESGN